MIRVATTANRTTNPTIVFSFIVDNNLFLLSTFTSIYNGFDFDRLLKNSIYNIPIQYYTRMTTRLQFCNLKNTKMSCF